MPRTPDALEGGRKTPSQEEKQRAPLTRVRSGGKVSQRLQILAEMYLRNRPKEDVRWVYSPTHKPELSNVVNRQIDGYYLVYVKDLGGESTVALLPGMEEDDLVRVGDVILMAIDAAVRRDIQAGLDSAAADEYARVEEEFYHSVDEISLEKGMRKEYKPRPLGSSKTELMEREVDVPESHREA